MRIEVFLTGRQADAVLRAELSVGYGVRRSQDLVEAERRIKDAIRTPAADPLVQRLDALVATQAKVVDLRALITAMARSARQAADAPQGDPRAALRALADHAERVVDIHRDVH